MAPASVWSGAFTFITTPSATSKTEANDQYLKTHHQGGTNGLLANTFVCVCTCERACDSQNTLSL